MTDGTRAERRLYTTTDGELVNEGDPRAAFLAYSPGDLVDDKHADAHAKLNKEREEADGDKSYDARAMEQAKPDTHQQPKGVGVVGEREATELADRAREIANSPDEQRTEALAAASDKPVAAAPIYRGEDGKVTYEAGGDRTQAYAAGDEINPFDRAAVKKLGDAPKSDDDTTDGDDNETPEAGAAAKRGQAPANKAQKPAPNK